MLEDGPINRRLNVFPDTHLLRLPGNLPEDPAAIPAESEESSEDESDGSERNKVDGGTNGDDPELSAALAASLEETENGTRSTTYDCSIPSSGSGPDFGTAEETDGDETELQRAIAQSLQVERPYGPSEGLSLSNMEEGSGHVRKVLHQETPLPVAGEVGGDSDDEEALARAIALSMLGPREYE